MNRYWHVCSIVLVYALFLVIPLVQGNSDKSCVDSATCKNDDAAVGLDDVTDREAKPPKKKSKGGKKTKEKESKREPSDLDSLLFDIERYALIPGTFVTTNDTNSEWPITSVVNTKCHVCQKSMKQLVDSYVYNRNALLKLKPVLTSNDSEALGDEILSQFDCDTVANKSDGSIKVCEAMVSEYDDEIVQAMVNMWNDVNSALSHICSHLTKICSQKELWSSLGKEYKKEVLAAQHWGDKFLEQNALKKNVVVTDSGLQYQIMHEGDTSYAKLSAKDTILVDYNVTKINGMSVDERRNKWIEMKQTKPDLKECFELLTYKSDVICYMKSEVEYVSPDEKFRDDKSVVIMRVTLKEIKGLSPVFNIQADNRRHIEFFKNQPYIQKMMKNDEKKRKLVKENEALSTGV